MSSNRSSSNSLTRHGAAARRSKNACGPRNPPVAQPLTSHTHRIGPAGLYFQPFLDPHLVLPEIAEMVLIQEAFIDAKVQVGQLDFPCIVAAEPAEAWHGVVFLANAKTMEMEVRPVEADLQDDVKIGQGAVDSRESAARASGGSPESRRGHSKLRAENRVP